ncbi:MAG: FTR1 family protein [Gammaproteobacteria bacterium]|jgi:high-affinity iron transporter|uniref:Iron permease FTR1 family protein n=1 Tax=SAR86 cluster bacterium TaxID=2030880 RepID=A0A520LRS4_9GAMM|nr:MAG: iron permease FTR1 family protein [SAR86 cluster bacterium]|tara:strand:+ start:3223 stop:4065 length:843 start_codon:yes stop_codon:yes gene_type:complete
MAEFIIVFREVLEASLVVGIIYLLIEKTNQAAHFTKLWYAVFASILASIAVGFMVIQAKNALGNNSTQALFEAVFLYLTAFLIWYVIFWLSKNVSDKKVLEGQALNAMEISSWGIFFVVFFAILREGFETAIFLISSFSITGTFSYIGFISGAVLAILIGYLIVRQGRKIDLRGVFKYTTLLLVFLSAGMIAYGTHEAEEYLVKSEQIEKSEIYRVWDILEPTQSAETGKTIYHPLHDKGSVGLFLKGFFGYNSNPNILEVILWFMAMLFGLNMWRRFYY